MNILFLEWKSFCTEDLLSAYKLLNHQVTRFPFDNKSERNDPALEAALFKQIQNNSYDYVFSFNYFPLVSKVCNQLALPYISWVYDSPYVLLYSYTTANPCNHIFVFDSATFAEFYNAGITTVHYLPMAANPDRLTACSPALLTSTLIPKTPVSFIGSMYTETHQFYDRMESITPYTKGYLEAIMAAQHLVYGHNFIESALPPAIISDMQNALPLFPNIDGVESSEYLFAQYVINRKLTGLERIEYLTAIGTHVGLDLYTQDSSFSFKGIQNHGTIDFYEMAPAVFQASPININISLRSIINGMPLRIFDIMGAGGFLMTNFQSDFLNFFIPGEDFSYFDNTHSLLEQIEYYIKNDLERKEIAANGLKKIRESHTFLHRIEEMETYL